MACYTAVEDLTSAEFHDDECIEVRKRAVTTVKKHLRITREWLQTKANHRGRILSKTASSAQGLRQRLGATRMPSFGFRRQGVR